MTPAEELTQLRSENRTLRSYAEGLEAECARLRGLIEEWERKTSHQFGFYTPAEHVS